MLVYIVRRLILMIPTILAITVITFIIIEAPPGDFMDTYVMELMDRGDTISAAEIDALRARYGLGQPIWVRYFKWLKGVVKGDLGRSLRWEQPVTRLIAQRLPWSLAVSFVSLIFVYIVAIPIGVYSATNQYSAGDYTATLLGFMGLATPNFLLALIFLWIYFYATGNVVVGLFSDEFQTAAWSFAKLVDLLKHLWIPAIIIGTAGTAGLIRVMRANLLDELQKPYVMVARSKGLSERRILYKYPFRIALNPVISTIGWMLPRLVNGELLTSMVLGLPTIAPLFVEALMNQDMFLAGSVVFILSSLTVIGTLISDFLLAWVDPRIRESV